MKNNVHILMGIGARHCMWNADFDSHAKTDANGNIYGSDKCLKYTMRNYWEVYKNKKILEKKSFKIEKGKLQPRTLQERFEYLIGKPINKLDIVEVVEELYNMTDVKQFGCTFPVPNYNLSITGIVQFSNGFNLDKETQEYEADILSPFKNSNEKSEDSKNSTKGTQNFVDEAHYVYNGIINPSNAHIYENIVSNTEYTNEDFEDLKDCCLHSVTSFNTCSKMGAENEFAIFITCKEEYNLGGTILSDKISFTRNGNIGIYDFDALIQFLNDRKDVIEKIEVFANEDRVEFDLSKLEIPYTYNKF